MASLRNRDESFSEIIGKVTGKARLSDFFGILSKLSGDELENNINEGRKLHSKLHARRAERLLKELS
ncbi:hypothetical protein HYU14_02710 [Candidatus Woesearchaeota archaeon]|nr:hypothetical protein [Candidatus Woesearchaeota archaeon]